MNEMRFPDADEILSLRAEGQVSVSSYLCRILSGTLALIFLFNSGLSAIFKDLLRVEDLSDPIFAAGLLKALGAFVSAILIYILVFSVSALLQTRFYFNPAAIFIKKSKLFSLFRSGFPSRITGLISVIAILCLVFLTLYIWKETFLAQLLLFNGTAARGEVIDVFLKSCYKISVILLFLIIPALAISFVFSKLSFGFRHRVKTKRG